MKRSHALSGILALAMLVACGATGPKLPSASSPPSAISPLPAASSIGASLVVATESDNGKTLNLKVGQRLEVRLHSTYWTFKGSSDSSVLRPAGSPVISPQPSGCVPGGGCGLVAAAFDVVTPGQAVISAGRTSCGEAMGCSADQSAYSLRVIVGA